MFIAIVISIWITKAEIAASRTEGTHINRESIAFTFLGPGITVGVKICAGTIFCRNFESLISADVSLPDCAGWTGWGNILERSIRIVFEDGSSYLGGVLRVD